MDNQLEKFIRDNARAFDQKEPDPAVLGRILRQMEGGSAQQEKKQQTLVVPMRFVRVAAACLIVLAGAGIWWISRTAETNTGITATVNKDSSQPGMETSPAPASTEVNNELANVADPAHTEEKQQVQQQHAPDFRATMAANRQQIFAGLDNMEAPSQRMLAAAKVVKLNTIDRDIIDALTHTLNDDPNTNVRLAALEALGKFHRENYVKKKLLESMKKQNDPMVQIALINMLTAMREKRLLNELDKIVNDTKTLDAVKDHAYSSILTLRS